MTEDKKVTFFTEPTEIEPTILDHQVQNCTSCGGELMESYGLAGGGLGVYGYCDKCERIVWKCLTE